MANQIIIRVPDSCREERRHILKWIFEERFQLKMDIEFEKDRCQCSISLEGQVQSILLPDVFFGMYSGVEEQIPMPISPLKRVELGSRLLPVLFGHGYSEKGYSPSEEGAVISVDIFGSAFWLLFRLEEVSPVVPLDRHSRFPFADSVAYRENFLNYPLIDHYLIFLQKVMEQVWSRPLALRDSYRVTVSHDIDRPYLYHHLNPAKIIAKGIRAKSYSTARQLWGKRNRARVKPTSDPFFCMDKIMDLSESEGMKSAFYILAGGANRKFDPCYHPDQQPFLDLLRRIESRGHAIGLHGSYETGRNRELLLAEFTRLKRIPCLNSEEVKKTRQHYLRWHPLETPRIHEELGIEEDASLCFAGHSGFRCGTCHSFAMFDLFRREPLKLRQQPLIFMDTTVLSPIYRGPLSNEKIFQLCSSLSENCKEVGGVFSMLWHNTFFADILGNNALENHELYTHLLRTK